jgi:hypothetical protein
VSALLVFSGGSEKLKGKSQKAKVVADLCVGLAGSQTYEVFKYLIGLFAPAPGGDAEIASPEAGNCSKTPGAALPRQAPKKSGKISAGYPRLPACSGSFRSG